VKRRLKDELLERLAADQNVRRYFCATEDESSARRCLDVDRANTAWLRSVIDSYGWPGIALVGRDGANAAFLIAQHSEDDDFQRTCLQLIETAVRTDDADPAHLAFLMDRVRLREGRPQVYGTQGAPQPFGSNGPIVPASIEDPDHVDERRSAVGLGPIREHFEELNRTYGRS
jgi:hypothetical protein